MSSEPEPFARDYPEGPSVRGYLHAAEKPSNNALVLTHGAGSNCGAPLLVSLAEEFAAIQRLSIASWSGQTLFCNSSRVTSDRAFVEHIDPQPQLYQEWGSLFGT